MDLVEVDRFAFDRKRERWFAQRIFTEIESEYAAKKRYPQQHFAGAFAAKEAFRKALGTSVPWRDVGVTHDHEGAPKLAFGPHATAALEQLGDVRVHLSISHTARNASATVVIERV